MKYSRKMLADGVGFSTVIDSKFKTNSLSVRFMTTLSDRCSADNVVAVGSLSTSSSAFTTLAKLTKRLSELYGASLNSSASKRGDIQILSLNSSWINNRYAIDSEDVTAQMLDLVCGCLFAPNAADGEFDAETYRITKNDLIDHIEAEINNKRGYAIERASQTAFTGEPAGCSCYGTRETAGAVTARTAYCAYECLMKNSLIEIFYVAPEENDSVENRLCSEFSKLSRTPERLKFTNKSPLKPELVRASDEMDVNQSKEVMSFKFTSEDRDAMKLFTLIYGATPVSKLFMNVREKLSLCYYCASRTLFPKGTMMVDIGVERENIDKAEKEILFQLDEMKNGNFTDEEMNSALLSIENALEAVGDTAGSYISWYLDCMIEDKSITPQEQAELYRGVTRERIIEAAKTVSLDSIYIMYNKEVQDQ